MFWFVVDMATPWLAAHAATDLVALLARRLSSVPAAARLQRLFQNIIGYVHVLPCRFAINTIIIIFYDNHAFDLYFTQNTMSMWPTEKALCRIGRPYERENGAV